MDMKVPENIKELHDQLKTAHAEMEKGIKSANEVAARATHELETYKKTSAETEVKLTEAHATNTKLQAKVEELGQRMQDAEQKMARRGGSGEPEEKSAGEVFIESEQYKMAQKARLYNTQTVQVPSLHHHKTLIVNATGQNQPLVPAFRAPYVGIERRRLTIRDLFPQIRVSSNSIEWPKLASFTNNAGPQWDTTSPTPGQEGATKPESAMTFTLQNVPVTTLAHWIPASRQVLSDAPMLRDIIDMELRLGLKEEEEDELLNGTGSNGQLSGIKANDTAFAGGVTNANAIDSLLRAITQLRLTFFEPTGIIMHPTDWVNVALLKDGDGRYLFSNPHQSLDTSIWGIPVVVTPAQTLGEFTVGAFSRAGFIADREDVTIRLSDQHSDFFVRNLVAILCEERLALVIVRSTAIVTGNVSHAG